MLNQVVLVGRIEKIEISENGTTITLSVKQSFKNENGEYISDLIKCTLWKGLASGFKDSLSCKGDLLGIKGRIHSHTENGELKSGVLIEKITYLSQS